MTTLSVISDLHLEFGSEPYITLPDSDVLILAGDVTVTADLRSHRTDARARKLKKATDRLCERINQRGYASVLAIAGNHEYYGDTLEEVPEFLREYYAQRGIKFLHNESTEIGEWILYGGPLWTNMGNRNPFVMMQAEQYMNDYRTITHASGDPATAEDTVLEHEQTVRGLTAWLDEPTHKRRCVITHHAPSYASIADRFKDNPEMNSAYASNLDYLVEEVDVWVHGHTHDFFDYTLGKCRVVCNPHGYHGYEANTGTKNIKIGEDQP